MANKLSFDKITAYLAKVPDELEGKVTQVGWHEGVAYADGTPVAYAAAIQEFGAPSQSIPPRPTLGPTLENNSSDYVKLLQAGTKKVMRGEIDGDEMLQLVGDSVAGDVRKSIAQLIGPALSPITIMLRGMKSKNANLKVTGATVGQAAARVAAGKTNYGASSKPLIDSGLMQSSVSATVEKS